MAAVVCLETMVKTEWLKPYWRHWSMPVPNPSTSTTCASVWVRTYALSCAVKRSVKDTQPLKISLRGQGPRCEQAAFTLAIAVMHDAWQ